MGYLLIAPAVLFLMAIIALPVLTTVKMSFQELDASTQSMKFVGLANYVALIQDPQFWRTFRNSFVFALASTIGHALAGIICALLLVAPWSSQGTRNFVRGLLILPWLFSLAAAALIWGLLLEVNGPINYVLSAIGLTSRPVDFFGDPKLAIWSLAAINVWKAYPFYLVMILGGIQSISAELYDAAKCDGASALQRFWHVTLPLLRPVLIATTTIDMITTITTFDLVKIMTNGGPMRSTQTLSFYIWLTGIRDVNFGYGAAMSIVLLITLGLCTLAYLSFANDRSTADAG